MQYKTGVLRKLFTLMMLYAHKEMAHTIQSFVMLVVHPYRAEGFAMHVQEALACGCITYRILQVALPMTSCTRLI